MTDEDTETVDENAEMGTSGDSLTVSSEEETAEEETAEDEVSAAETAMPEFFSEEKLTVRKMLRQKTSFQT